MKKVSWIVVFISYLFNIGCQTSKNEIVTTVTNDFMEHKEIYFKFKDNVLSIREKDSDIYRIGHSLGSSIEISRSTQVDDSYKNLQALKKDHANILNPELSETVEFMKNSNIGALFLYVDSESFTIQYDELSWISSLVYLEIGKIDSVYSPTTGRRSLEDLRKNYSKQDEEEWAWEIEPGWNIVVLKDNL